MTLKIISGDSVNGSAKPAAVASSSHVFSREDAGASAVSALDFAINLSAHSFALPLTRLRAFVKEPLPYGFTLTLSGVTTCVLAGTGSAVFGRDAEDTGPSASGLSPFAVG